MVSRTPLLRRPVRVVAIIVGGAALLVGATALLAGRPVWPVLAFGVGYGGLLGAYVVGVILAAESPATRWWWCAALPVLLGKSVVLAVLVSWPGVFGWWRVLLGGALAVLGAWLAAGGLLSALGWWSYARRHWAAADA